MRISNNTSFNNKVIVEAYKKEELRTNTNRQVGFAMIDQKTKLKPLKVLVSAILNNEVEIEVGQYAFIKEELLHTAPWAKNPLEAEGIPGQFIIVDLSHIEFISPYFTSGS